MPEEQELVFKEETDTPEEEVVTEEVPAETGRKVKIDWLENDIWNGKTGYIVWEDQEDTSDLGTVTVKITDFPTEDGFQEVEQNFERRHVVDYVEAEAEEEKIFEEPVEEVPEEEPIEREDEIKVEEETTTEALNEEIKEPEEQECCICHKMFKGYGNNAQPVCDGLCCDECNYLVVIPTRIKFYNATPFDIDFKDEEYPECEDCREKTLIPDDDIEVEYEEEEFDDDDISNL